MAPSPDQEWWQTGVVYQIYPRSFGDSNGDGLGDLEGIIRHLDHLNDGTPRSLGVDAIWLSPIYPSPDFDFGYDVADYTGIDGRYGTTAGFDVLVAGAHARGIKVILDLVLNHSSHRHAWFEASRASRSGSFADWYIWRDSPGVTRQGRRRPPNNWRSFFGGPAWTWDEARGQFYLHTFLAEQPDLNWRNPEVRRALLDVVRTWLDRGVDGFRLDVFNTFFKDAALRSNPPRRGGRGWGGQHHVYDRDQPELRGLLDDLRAIVDAQPGRMTVGELFDGSIEDAAGYVAPHHLVFDWAILGRPWDAAAFARAVVARDAAFGPDRWPANALSNHDQPRHASRYAGDPDGLGDARAKVAATMLLTLRGTPFLYYGEEIGQRDLVIPNAAAFDPQARRSSRHSPAWNRDQCRGPIAWSGEPGGGFSMGRPWLPLSPDAPRRNVATQASEADSVFSHYRRALWLRRSTPALRDGDQQIIVAEDPAIFAYRRRSGTSAALVVLNFEARRTAFGAMPAAAPGREWRLALSTAPHAANEALAGAITLEPLEALVAVEA